MSERNEISEVVDFQTGEEESTGISMIVVLAILIATFIAWAALFKFDTTVRATGKIIPKSRTQVIQVADGGVLSDILVTEGMTVKKGQLLAVLEKNRAEAKYEEERARVLSLEVALVRATAESQNRKPQFDSIPKDGKTIIKAQQNYYQQRKRQLARELDILQSSLQMAKVELQMNKNLLKSGDANRIEVMRAQRQVNEANGKVIATRNKYLDEAHKEIIKTETELKSLRFKLGVANSVLTHTDIISPVDGVVKILDVNTLGGVMRSGDEIMQISPSKGGLVVEAKIIPVDIADLRLNMPVFVKLDAYDPSIYGNLQGILTYIGSDTLTEKDASGRESIFYSAHVIIDEEHLKNTPKLSGIVLKQGMSVSIDVVTGEKTVLNYLTKPLTKAFAGAVH